jgi:peptide/nickel transport system ATP-binding protein
MSEPVIEVIDLKKHYEMKTGLFQSLLGKQAPTVHAVDGVSFKIMPQQVFGLVGESGCGKTTTGRLVTRLIEPTEGKVLFDHADLAALKENDLRKLRGKMQMIFQDPYESLDPRMSIYDIITEPIEVQKIAETPEEMFKLAAEALEALDLSPPEEFLFRFPHELSGGQRQRVAIARAFVVRPKFIVADEPVSMLDASIRSEVTKLTLELIKKTKCAFLYITHDLALSRYICDRIAVMYLGKIVESGPVEEVIMKPLHPYTNALLAAVPVPDPTARRVQITIKGEVPSASNLPPGCRFNTRCPYAREERECMKKEPILTEVSKDHLVACHRYSSDRDPR